jgi:cyclic-di-GMP-binding protein
MPSFDIVSSVEMQEVVNAVDQTRREIETRYDFKGSKATVTLSKEIIEVLADDQMKLDAIDEILRQKLAKRQISLKSVKFGDAKKAGGDMLRQEVTVKQGLTEEELKRVQKLIKAEKFKVTAQTQGDEIRVSGKKRDDLQTVIGFLRSSVEDIDLQYVNFRD